MIKIAFDHDWEYTEASGMLAVRPAEWQPVTVPHDVSIAKARGAQYPTGGSGGYAWSGTDTYRKKFHVPEDWQGKAVQLEFEGVYMNTEVSVNSHPAVFHPYGYTSFLVDLHLRQVHVPLHHRHRALPRNALPSGNVTSISRKLRGSSVPEFVLLLSLREARV